MNKSLMWMWAAILSCDLPLVMGAPVTIDVRNDGATLQFDIEGVQREVNTADITAAQTPAAVRMRLAGKRE